MFYLTSYELVAQESGEVMVAKLVKETETQSTALVGVKGIDRKIGYAGTLELIIYDQAIIDRMKTKLGQKVDVKVVL